MFTFSSRFRVTRSGKSVSAAGWHVAASLLVLGSLAAALTALGWSDANGQPKQPPAIKPATPYEVLTSKALPPAPDIAAIKAGDSIATSPGQRKMVALPDGTLLYVNEKTTVKLEAPRQLVLASGEIYVETTPGTAKQKPAALVVDGPGRTITAQDGSFAVQVQENRTGVLVARGSVQVSGLALPLAAGQRLAPDTKQPASAPRPAHVLHWTRELMTAAEAALVPASEFAGGALVAIDPNGQETKLSLRKYVIDVHIEDGFARTTIDQVYFNHENTDLEGTFYFPLPADASLSRLAMYVDGKLMEGGMAERSHAAEVYETIRYLQKDPALLEWVDGSTFKMRVFPLEARKEKRIILSYTQKLDSLYGQASYRFPSGHSLPAVKHWSLKVRVKGGAEVKWASPSHTLQSKKDKGDLLLSAHKENALFNKDVVLQVTDPALTGDAAKKIKFALAEHEGQKYLMMKLRPDLLRPVEEVQHQAGPKNWLFLFESSGDRDPLLARVQIEVIRNMLLLAQPGDTFNVLTANTKVRAFDKSPQQINADSIEEAILFLESSHLIGALDLGQAFTQAADFIAARPNTFLVHCGTGIAAMGEKRVDVLAKHLPKNTRYVGVGVGKRWDRSLMKTLAEKSGGYFTQINPDEPISWRAFELAGTLQTLGPDGLRKVEITELTGLKGPQPRLLYFNELLAQGEELCAVTRLDGKAALPTGIKLKFGDGQTRDVPLAEVKKDANYLPRMWARLEIDRLLADNAAKHKQDIIALSKAMYVMSPFTSLLVLETEDMYMQFGVDKGRKDHWAMYPAPEQILVVYEPDPDMPKKPKGAKTAKEVLQTIAKGGTANLLYRPASGEVKKQMDMLGIDNTPLGELVLRKLASKAIDVVEYKADGESLVNIPSLVNPDDPISQGHWLKNSSKNIPLPPAPPIPEPFSPALSLKLLDSTGSITYKSTGGILQQETAIKKLIEDANGIQPFGNAKLPVYPVGELVIPLKSSSLEYVVPSPVGGYNLGGASGWPGSGGLALDEFVPASQVTVVPITGTSSAEVSKLVALIDGKTAHGINYPKSTLYSGSSDSLLYSRPGYSENNAIFYNLLAYAPGMSNSSADVLAVLEAEAFFARPVKQGKVDARAQQLFAKARNLGWQQWTMESKKGQPASSIVFDGQGRFAYQQTLPPGLKEQVACDGQTLVHQYPQLGLAAKRTVSRFHRSSISALLPWVVPPTDDLAKGADVKLIDAHTVDIIAHGAGQMIKDKDGKEKEATSFRLRLIFADSGALAERQIVVMPKNKVLLRQVCQSNGVVKWLDEKGKELAALQGKLSPAQPPDVQPEIKTLIVLDLPHRTPNHVRATLKLKDKSNDQLTFAQATALLASHVAHGNGNDARGIFQSALYNRNQKQLGYYVLLASAGQNLDSQNLNILDDHPDAPLAQYLALHSSPVLRQQASQWAVNSVNWQEPFLKHFATTHALYQRWQSKQADNWKAERLQKERDQAFQYVRDNKDSAFGWVMLTLLQNKAGKDKAFYADLAKLWPLFQDSALGYAARYEEARCLWKAGLNDQAQQKFHKLYAGTLKDGSLPAIDDDFRNVLLAGADGGSWSSLMEQTAAQLIADKKRPTVLALAWQCWQLGDGPQANQLLQVALSKIKDEKEQIAMNLAGVLFYQQTTQLPQADQLLSKLLADPKQAQRPGLWRLASKIAQQRGQTARSLECLETALDLEFRDLPNVIDLQQVRGDYGRLLDHYRNMADAVVALKIEPPPGFVARVIKTADRWRSLDPQRDTPSTTTADILLALGQKDLSWDYLTTPVSKMPNESGPWVGMATNLRQSGELVMADLAYKAAFEAEPTNAQILWDRAENLQQSGKTVQAQELFRQLAESTWQPRFQGLAAQAKQRLR